MVDGNQLVPNQQLPDTYYRTLSPWTVAILVGCFLPIPTLHQRPVTLVTREELTDGVKSSSPVKHLPPAWILGQKDRNCTLAGVMARLTELEKREVNLHLKQDYRQAWITLSLLQKGRHDAFVQSSYVIYGLHPENVWPARVADAKARLGAEYFDWYDSADNLRPDVPKIPPNTADADTHAANGANSLTTGTVGPVPKERIV